MRKILLSVLVVGAVGGTVFAATNAFFSDTETSTGNIFTAGTLDLKVDSKATYNGQAVTSATWELKDLVPTVDKFFNFTDVKPGDVGENTISLHVINNDAWACIDVSNYQSTAGSSSGAKGTGKLGNELQFFAWNDINCNNVFEPTGETKLFSQASGIGNASDVLGGKTYALADSSTGTGPLSGGPIIPNSFTNTHCIGLSWCAGTMTVNLTTGAISCDGSTMGNEAQGDSVSTDIAFRVVQSRNNPNFVCQPLKIGASLGNYVAPTNCTEKVGVGETYPTIQSAVNAANPDDTICVDNGTYSEDVTIGKSLTLAGAGASATSIINGQSTGYTGAVQISSGVNNVTVEGFQINGTGVAAVYLVGNNSNIIIQDNKLVSPSGNNDLLGGGKTTNSSIYNNVIVGTGANQLVYINGDVSLGAPNASSNVNFSYNTFDGTIVSGGEALGIESTGSSVTRNVFKSSLSSTSTIAETWKSDALFNENNFDKVGGTQVKNSAPSGTLNAQNNWWGDTSPADNVTGLVNFTPFASSAYTEL